MKWEDTERREPEKSDWFQRRAQWLPPFIPSTESAASACRCRIPQRQRLPSRNPDEKKLSWQESSQLRKYLFRKSGNAIRREKMIRVPRLVCDLCFAIPLKEI